MSISIITLLVSLIGGFLLGVIYLRKIEASSKEIIYHSFVLGEAFIIMLFITEGLNRDFNIMHMITVCLLWAIFSIASALGAKGGEK